MFLEIKLTALLNARKVKLHKATATNNKLVDMRKELAAFFIITLLAISLAGQAVNANPLPPP